MPSEPTPQSLDTAKSAAQAPATGAGARTREVLQRLRALGDPGRLAGMARYGIATERAYGVRIPELRALARELGVDHRLALRLWDSDVHEARILAGMVDDPALVDEAQMDRWATAFDSWDLCDQVCANLFRRMPAAYGKACEWIGAGEPLVKRAGFSLIAGLTVHDKRAPDERFAALLPLIAGAADDDRDLVRKGASWALRQIGKRSRGLNALAIETALELRASASPGARWIGADALRELRGPRVQARLGPA